MTIRPTHLRKTLFILGVAGCMSRGAETTQTAPLTAADSIRCAAINDSLGALPIEKLPDTRVGRFKPPRARRFGGGPFRTVFLVRPDGTADTTAVFISGVQSDRYRRETIKAMTNTRFNPAIISGCAVTSKVDYVTVGVMERADKVPFTVPRRP